jgi:UDP-glucose 4-epimerase
VYGANQELPKRETTTPAPVSPYAVSKLAAEAYAISYSRCFSLPVLVFRFFNVFGPLQRPGHPYAAVVPRFIDAALRGDPLEIHGDGKQTRDFTYVGTVAQVIGDAVVNGITRDGPVNLAFGTRTSILKLADQLEEILGHELCVQYSPPRAGDVRDSQADNGVLRTLFPGVAPIDLRRGLSDTIAWFHSAAGEKTTPSVTASED